jgi:hypothetical protein
MNELTLTTTRTELVLTLVQVAEDGTELSPLVVTFADPGANQVLQVNASLALSVAPPGIELALYASGPPGPPGPPGEGARISPAAGNTLINDGQGLYVPGPFLHSAQW